jgi:hypothetical protein
MRLSFLFIVLALVASAANAGPYKDLCDRFEPLRKLEGLKYVKPEIKVAPQTPGVKPQDVVFTIEAKAGTINVSPGPDALLVLPMSDRLCAENPNYTVNQPKGTLNLQVSIDPAIPPVRTLDYRLLEALRHDWDEAVSRQNFAYRVMMPSAKAYQVLFEGKGGSAEVKLSAGPRKFTADEKGELRIPFDESWIAANPTIVFSEVPKKIGLAY